MYRCLVVEFSLVWVKKMNKTSLTTMNFFYCKSSWCGYFDSTCWTQWFSRMSIIITAFLYDVISSTISLSKSTIRKEGIRWPCYISTHSFSSSTPSLVVSIDTRVNVLLTWTIAQIINDTKFEKFVDVSLKVTCTPSWQRGLRHVSLIIRVLLHKLFVQCIFQWGHHWFLSSYHSNRAGQGFKVVIHQCLYHSIKHSMRAFTENFKSKIIRKCYFCRAFAKQIVFG